MCDMHMVYQDRVRVVIIVVRCILCCTRREEDYRGFPTKTMEKNMGTTMPHGRSKRLTFVPRAEWEDTMQEVALEP